ncbi:CoA transferase [Desulfitobacterium sp.]|uniref:CoA transferase n=1 Tax=Desulfitobacterium sp. TaxID=49981 RepID=UPI002CB82C99|nr:CoA transferase [Desulfitobacterium sp.]HVJ49988.1 CoA transferase [Desulfitobacterium sp.]
MSMPLEGIKILDLSRYLPGPLATQILADFGAEVLKIEDRKGELGRYLPPMINDTSARFYTVMTIWRNHVQIKGILRYLN